MECHLVLIEMTTQVLQHNNGTEHDELAKTQCYHVA
jgi:hypothetical protein